MSIIEYDLENEKVKYLIETDEKLGKLIKFIKQANIIIEEDGFKCIVKYIIGQQISDKARETIWQRICKEIVPLTPEKVLTVSITDFRNYGLSERKIIYIKSLAQAIVNKEIEFDTFPLLSNEEIIKKLTSVKGIGMWTAEMYLIFSLGRENVLSKSDGTIRRTIQWMYSLDNLPTEIELDNYFKNWKNYATIVSTFLWKSIELGLTKEPFDEII
ncbi:MAG: DNA-3-methyladenine glycosylase 2 family protein [Bacilli bacterium]|nr:DNA-3-methyladenine glycosylase 2 family protein [Bacilli bacterium]